MNKEIYELSYSMKKEMEKKVSFFVILFISVFVVINLIITFLIFPVFQRSISMQPDIQKDSCVLFSPLDTKIKRGDVVLLASENSEKTSFVKKVISLVVRFFTAQQISTENLHGKMGKNQTVRRIVGIPGDTLYMRDYVLYIKPKGEQFFLTEFELVKKSYNVDIDVAPASWDYTLGVAGSFDEITLGSSEYFVLGDKRSSCVDSRLWGAIQKSDIKAVAIMVFFPFNKIRFF